MPRRKVQPVPLPPPEPEQPSAKKRGRPKKVVVEPGQMSSHIAPKYHSLEDEF